MKKRVLALTLAAMMVTGLVAGCGDSAQTQAPAADNAAEQAAPEEAADDEAPAEEVPAEEAPAEEAAASDLDISEPVTLKWYLHGSNVTDDTAVMEKVNEYLGEKLNVTLEPIWGTWGDFDEGSTLAINSGDDVDIYFTCSWSLDEYNQYAKKGAWVRLDDPENNLIEKYGQDAWALLPDVLKEGAEIDGVDGYGVYAFPVFKDFAIQNTYDVNVTRLNELGYTLDDFKKLSYYEMGDLFQAAKDKYGDSFYPLVPEGMVLERLVNNSIIVNGDVGSVNLLSYYIDTEDVSKDIGSIVNNRFATPEFKKFAEKTREYYLAGYIDPGTGNPQTAADAVLSKQKTAEYLVSTQSYALGYESQTSKERGIEVAYVPQTPPYVDKTSTQGAMMAISTASKHPDRAMAFLNLLNSDPYLTTLLEYGVEGIHYELNDDGLVVFNDEMRASYSPWRNGMANITLLPPQEGEGKDFFTDTFIPYYQSAKGIPAFGYVFDASSVESEMSACANVASQYALSLCVGSVDVDTALPEFLDKLEDAGMSKIVEEADAQMETYFANQQ